MRFLICGLGSIGRRHLRNLQALGQKDIVLLRSGKSTLPDDELAGLRIEHDLARALKRWRPDAVVISNPTALHLGVAIAAAEAGCNLLIEKPVSHTMDGIEELQNALRRGGGKVLVGFQFRFHPGLQQVKHLLVNEAIGRPISARAHWGEYLPAWHPWEDYRDSYSARADLGGGVVLTLCHPFDYLRWFFGEVASVSAETARSDVLGLSVEDFAEAILAFIDGPYASVHLDYNQQPASHWLEIVGEKGTIGWNNADGGVRWWSGETGNWQTVSVPEDFERNTMFVDEMHHFMDVVQGKARPICSLTDGVRVLEIALGVKRAARQGQRVAFD
jgi:predicted dehydrogenase